MARPKPDPEQVFPEILSTATQLIREQGFDRLTMKALALACGMSVGKLYHFVPSKDALFLHLEIDYFDRLTAQLEQVVKTCLISAVEDNVSARTQFTAVIRGYFDFAIANLDLYKLVTSPPKVFSHYRGTESEQLAQRELLAALRTIDYCRERYRQAREEAGLVSDEREIQADFLMCINGLHGLILLSQSSAWPYIAASPSDVVRQEGAPASASDRVDQQLERLIATLL